MVGPLEEDKGENCMLKIKLDSCLPKPSDEMISSTEKFYRIKFPDNYIEFLKKNNGAIPITNVFEFNNHEYLVERFLCLLGDGINDYDEGWADIEVTISEISERLTDDGKRLGKKIVPIAVLFAGNYVCLDFREDEMVPSVCIWYHEESRNFAPVTRKVTDNFEEFLNILYEPERSTE